jgi:hypothetical protein
MEAGTEGINQKAVLYPLCWLNPVRKKNGAMIFFLAPSKRVASGSYIMA